MKTSEFFKALVIMAVSDGKLSAEELALLSQRATRWGISQSEFDTSIREARAADAAMSLPHTKGERHQLLREMIQVMAADGDLADIEKNLFAVAAATMQISDDELNQIFDAVLPPPETTD
jgi:DnaJ-domain-containing protein 1